jgi:predicted enzyme related to lactoylglutathione lyase
MFRLTLISFLLAFFVNCHQDNKKATEMKEQKNNSADSEKDTIPKVTGIGGIFFISENPKEAREWYAKNLGFEFNDWGSSGFDSRNLNNPDEVNTLQWTLFKKGSDYFEPSKKEFMINYRVQNIEGLVKKLKANGVTIVDSITAYDFGKFIHIMDNEGNKIELWEPADENENKK